jgi:hypothetical protein
MVEIADKSTVSEENQIPVPEDKLKEERKKGICRAGGEIQT